MIQLSSIKQYIKGNNIYGLSHNNSVSIDNHIKDIKLYFLMYITTLNYFGKWNNLNYKFKYI